MKKNKSLGVTVEFAFEHEDDAGAWISFLFECGAIDRFVYDSDPIDMPHGLEFIMPKDDKPYHVRVNRVEREDL